MSRIVQISECELKALLKESAREGSRQALSEVGLDDEHAGTDIKNLRGLLAAYRDAKKTAWQTLIRAITIFTLGAITFGIVLK